MATEIFTKTEFENALSKYGNFSSVGVVYGEYCYILKVDSEMGIYVRSSVHFGGVCAETGKDSIRAYLYDFSENRIVGNPKKDYHWTTRSHGWDSRMGELINKMKNIRNKIGSHCNKTKIVLISHTKTNPDRLFCKCRICGQGFEWVN